MKARPIIFSAESVRAILDGRKTQTRRVMLPQPSQEFAPSQCEDYEPIVTNRKGEEEPGSPIFGCYDANGEDEGYKCPFGRPGDQLWVRETWANYGALYFRADGQPGRDERELYPAWTWRSPIHMPRVFSRLTLEIVRVRVERLQEISEPDAMDEGLWDGFTYTGPKGYCQRKYMELWDKLNAKRGYPWSSNPFVWVIEFRRMSDDA